MLKALQNLNLPGSCNSLTLWEQFWQGSTLIGRKLEQAYWSKFVPAAVHGPQWLPAHHIMRSGSTIKVLTKRMPSMPDSCSISDCCHAFLLLFKDALWTWAKIYSRQAHVKRSPSPFGALSCLLRPQRRHQLCVHTPIMESERNGCYICKPPGHVWMT